MTTSIKALTSKRSLDDKKKSYEFQYVNWKDFTTHAPWNSFRNMELCNYIWTDDNILYIFFESLTPPEDKRYFKINVVDEDETYVREWLKERISAIWLI
jgi:hypothetical protein